MEQVAQLLDPFADYIGGAASFYTSLHFLSGSLVCYQIFKKKSTAEFSIIPFLGGLIM